MLDDGKISVNWPSEEFNAINLSINRGDTPIFGGKVSITGEMLFDQQTQSISLPDGTTITTTFDNYEVTAKVVGEVTSAFSMTADGLKINPSGKMEIALNDGTASVNATMEILSGSFILGDNGALTIAKDTELKFDFGGGHIVDFKATNDASGKISLGADGITFTPNEGDGNLKISVTRDGETRTASLDMTGSLTYKLDGSISLTKDTVLKSVFDDDSALTITANKDADGKIVFSPQDGLIITPATPDALSVLLSADGTDIIKLGAIDGTVTYGGGTFTASDGTEIRFVDPAGIYPKIGENTPASIGGG